AVDLHGANDLAGRAGKSGAEANSLIPPSLWLPPDIRFAAHVVVAFGESVYDGCEGTKRGRHGGRGGASPKRATAAGEPRFPAALARQRGFRAGIACLGHRLSAAGAGAHGLAGRC